MFFLQILLLIVLVLLAVYLLFASGTIKVASGVFLVTLAGVIVGLSIGALVTVPLSRLADPYGQWLPLVVNVFIVALVTNFFYTQRRSFGRYLEQLYQLIVSLAARGGGEQSKVIGKEVLLDTSAIIDGRVLEVARTGFLLNSKLLVPKFVLEELQRIADSEDDLKRARGRRGLDVLNRLGKEKDVRVQVLEGETDGNDVDAKIVRLAKERKARLMTVDFNLNKVAQIQGVTVLNINELHDAMRPVVLPGEILEIKIIQEGKDKTQGVGYLEDGTMVVVESGRRFLGKEIEVVVTRMFQTAAGKMIFGVPREEAKNLENRR